MIATTIREMCTFCAERLHVSPALRIAAALDSSAKTGAVSGSLITEPLERFRLPSLEQVGYEVPIARSIATNWWGTGCRIEGPGGLFLQGGIAYAVGLAWAASHLSKERFDMLVEYYEKRTARESHFRRVPYRAGERTVGIGFVIFHALSKQPDVWNSLQQLTSEFWGRNVLEDVVLARLQEAGVPTRDFVRMRFQRTDTPQ